MTEHDPWDDDRLGAAYAARGDAHPTPDDLTATTNAFVRAATTHGRPSTTPRRLAIAAMVAVVIGGVGLAIVSFPQPSGPGAPTPSDAAGEATVSPPASASSSIAAPTQVAGLTVISVSDAMAVRDSGADGRELAVRGWYTAIPLPCPSMDPGPSSPIQPTCANTISWLMQDDEDLGLPGSGQPTGPAIHADLGGVTGFATPSPADVVMIGHFDDRRADQCPADAETACRDEFVVDRICWVDGRELEVSDRNDLGGPSRSTAHEVAGLILTLEPGGTILSAVTVPGGRLPEFEPVIVTHDEYSLAGESGVWIVRMVVGGEPITYLVVDGTHRTYRMTPDGRVLFLGETAGPGEIWPPAGAAMVEVPGVEIAVVDLSNHLLGVGTESLDGTTPPPDIAAKPIHLAETTTPGDVLLTWSGSGCDVRATVTIDAELGAIAVERVERSACEGDARTYGLTLTFDDPVDVDSVELSTTRRVSITP